MQHRCTPTGNNIRYRMSYGSQAAPPFAGEPAAPWTINAALGLPPAVAGVVPRVGLDYDEAAAAAAAGGGD